MTNNQIVKLQKSLPVLRDIISNEPFGFDDYSLIRNGCLFVHNEGSAITYDSYDFGGYIAPELEAWAEKHGGYWEKEDASCIVFAHA